MDNTVNTEQAQLEILITAVTANAQAMIDQLMSSGVAAATRVEEAWSKVGAGMGGVGEEAAASGAQMAEAGAAGGAAIEEVGNKAIVSGAQMAMMGAMLVAPIKDAIDNFTKFDAALTNVQAEGAAGGMALADMGKQFQTVAEATGQSSTAMAEGMYKVGAAGYQGADGVAVMAQAAKAATADQADLTTVSQALIAELGAYKNGANGTAIGVGDLQKATDIMLGTVANGVLRLDEFSANIAKIAPLGATMGVSLQELGAGMATLTKDGLTATQATNELSAIMSALLKPSKALSDEFHANGIASGEALIASKGFGGALEELKTLSGGSDEALAHLIPNIRAIKGEVSLASGEFQSYFDTLGKVNAATEGAGQTQEAFNAQTQSLKFTMDQAKASMEAAGQAAGAALAPYIKEAADAVAGLADWFSGLPGPVQTVIVGFVALTGGVLVLSGAMGILGITTAGLATAFGLLLSPVTLIIAALAIGAGLIISNWSDVSDAVGKAGSAIGTVFANMGDDVKKGAEAIGTALGNFFTQDLPNQLRQWGSDLVGFLASGIADGIPVLGPVIDSIGEFMGLQMTPHSPPPFAPWMGTVGQQWVALIGQGMTNADFGFIDQLGSTLQTRFEQILGTNNKFNVAAAVFGTQSDISAILDAYRNGGDVTQAMMDKIRADMQGQGADVQALVAAYLALQTNLAAVNTLEKDKVALQTDETNALKDTQAAIDGINASLTTEQGIMNGLKQTEADQAAAVQPYVDQLAQANSDLADAQTAYSNMQDQLSVINDKQAQQLDLITQQSQQISYQDEVAQRGANADLLSKSRAARDEQRSWDEEQLRLKIAIAQAGGSGKTGTAQGNALAAQMAQEQQQHDLRMNQLNLQKDKSDDVLTSLKDKEQDTLTPLQQRTQDIQNGNAAQKDSYTNALAQQKVAIDTAKLNKDAAQQQLDNASVGLVQTKQQIADEQVKINQLTAQHTIAVAAYDAIKKPLDLQITGLDTIIAQVKAQTGPLQDNLNIANDRVKAENQVVTQINAQTTAINNAATAATHAANAAAKRAATAAAKGGPLDAQIDDSKNHIDTIKIAQLEATQPLQKELDDAKAAGDKVGTTAAQANLDAMNATFAAQISPYQTQYNIDMALTDQWKNGHITAADAVAQHDSTAISTHNKLVADSQAAANPAGDPAQGGFTGPVYDPSKLVATTQDVKDLKQAFSDLIGSGMNESQAQTAVNKVAIALHFTVGQRNDIYNSAKDASGKLPDGVHDGIDITKIQPQIDLLKGLGLTVADGLKSSNPEVRQAAEDISTALLTSARTKLGMMAAGGDSTVLYGTGKDGAYSVSGGLRDPGAVTAVNTASTTLASGGITGWIGGITAGIPGSIIAMQNWVKTGILDTTHAGLGLGEGFGVLGGYGTTASAGMITALTAPLLANPFSAPFGNALQDMLDKGKAKIGSDTSGPAFDLGGNVDSGVSAGIDGGIGGLAQKGVDAVNAILAAARTAAGAHSPARTFADYVGAPIAQGVGAGIDENTGVPVQAGQNMIQQTLDAMQRMKKLAKMTGEDLSGAVADGFGNTVSPNAPGYDSNGLPLPPTNPDGSPCPDCPPAPAPSASGANVAPAGGSPATPAAAQPITKTVLLRIEHMLQIAHSGKLDGATPEFVGKINDGIKPLIEAAQVEVIQKVRGIFQT